MQSFKYRLNLATPLSGAAMAAETTLLKGELP